jgi:hypothetical protein
MSITIRFAVVFFLFFAVAAVSATGTQFEVFDGFPKAAPGAFGIRAEGLPDGRFIVWNGDAVFLQIMAGGDTFKEVASGYAGEPGFVAVAPDGHTVLLGAGSSFSGKLYVFDTRAPVNYSPGSEVAAVTHYYGVYLTQDLVLLDRLTDDSATSELVVLDLSSPSPVPVRVMLKPDQLELTGEEQGVSACLAVNGSRATVYMMGLVYDSGVPVSSELKMIPASVLISAYQSKALLDWDSDAIAIGLPGSFNSGGPAGVMANGDLIIGGFGGVQRVNPSTATIVETYAPPALFDYYGVATNPYRDIVLPIVLDPVDYSMDIVYAPEGAFAAMPVHGGIGLAAMTAMILSGGARSLTGRSWRVRLRRRMR